MKQAAWVQGRRAIIVDIHKQPGGNVVETVDQIRRVLPSLERTLPAGQRCAMGPRIRVRAAAA